jgi:hypothetical protein
MEQGRMETSFGTPVYQDMSFGAEELNWVESSELAVAEIARNIVGFENKTSCVILCDRLL